MQQKSHRAYPPEIIQTSLLGRLQKKSLEHNDCLYAASILEKRVRKPPMDNTASSRNYFQKNFSAFKKHWNNTGQICLKVLMQTRDLFLHTGLTEHYIFFVTRSMAFFSSNVFIISIFVFFVIRRQLSKLTLKTKWYHNCGCCDDFQSCEQMKKHVNDKYFEKKLDLEPESHSLQVNYVTITIIE